MLAFQLPRKRLQDISACVGFVKRETRRLFDAVSTMFTSAFNNAARVYIPHLVSNVQVLFLTRLHIFHALLFIADECEHCCGNASSGQVFGVEPKWIILICLVTDYSFFSSHSHSYGRSS